MDKDKERELLRRVLKILNEKFDYYLGIEAEIEAELAKPEPEPFAWSWLDNRSDILGFQRKLSFNHPNHADDESYIVTSVRPLYISPPSKELTDGEILSVVDKVSGNMLFDTVDEYNLAIARAVLKAAE